MNALASLTNLELLSATHDLARRSCGVEADLLVHLGEIDDRKLYLERAHPSMFAFCTRELGFSEGAAYNRIQVARAARRLPAIVDTVRTGRLHLAGLRLLAPHLTVENCEELLARATGRTKEEIAGLVATLAPKPVPPSSIRKLPEARPLLVAESKPRPEPPPARAVVPIAEETFKVQFAISREFREEIRQAQDLLRHRVPDGDFATIFRMALAALVTDVRKERFGVVGKPRTEAEPVSTGSRHVPAAIRRAVYERDGGRCAFLDDRGVRCVETGALEFDHVDGFARTHLHDVDALRLLCRAHNQHAAEKMYGRAHLEAARSRLPKSSSSAG